MNDSISSPNRVHRLFAVNPRRLSAEPVWTKASVTPNGGGVPVALTDLAAERLAFAAAVRLHPSTMQGVES